MTGIIRPPTNDLPFNEIIRTLLSILMDVEPNKPPEEPSDTTMQLFLNAVGILTQLGFRMTFQDDKFLPHTETILRASGPRRKSMIVMFLSHCVNPTTDTDRILDEASSDPAPEVRAAAVLGYAVKIIQAKKPSLVHPANIPPHPGGPR